MSDIILIGIAVVIFAIVLCWPQPSDPMGTVLRMRGIPPKAPRLPGTPPPSGDD